MPLPRKVQRDHSPRFAGVGVSDFFIAADQTQQTNRTTAVTSNGLGGKITTNNASLAAEASADFTVNNSFVAVGDVVHVCQRSGSNGGGTLVDVVGVAAGSFTIRVHNGNVAAGTAETGAIILDYIVFKKGTA